MFLLSFLISSTANKYIVIGSFHFAEEICQWDPNLRMASLDLDSLFTNIPLDETIDICLDNLYNGHENPRNILKHDFNNLLNICLTKNHFTRLRTNVMNK